MSLLSRCLIVAAVYLSTAACTSPMPDPPVEDPTVTADGGVIPPKDCTACAANQVCIDGACAAIPNSCPCPKETYCDLATTTCKVGCTSDMECSSGRICNTNSRTCFVGCRMDTACAKDQICDSNACRAGCRKDVDCGSGKICALPGNTCVEGCRKDADCGGGGKICNTATNTCSGGCRMDSDCTTAGQICDTTSNMCRPGCRTTATCPKEQVCDTTNKKCVAGCDSDTRCNTGRICESSMCQDGCRTSDSCALGTYCDSAGTKKCVSGCNRDVTRCPIGQACVGYVDGSSKCQVECYGWACNGTNWSCYKQGSDNAGARCRLGCSSDTDCTTSGHRCTWFTKNASYPGMYSAQYCAQPCTVAGCTSAVDPYGMSGTLTCDAPSKECRMAFGARGYQTSPSYGL